MELSDGSRGARESDFRRVSRQVLALNTMLRDVQERLFVLETAAASARADLVEAREIDEQLAEAVESLLEDVTSGR